MLAVVLFWINGRWLIGFVCQVLQLQQGLLVNYSCTSSSFWVSCVTALGIDYVLLRFSEIIPLVCSDR